MSENANETKYPECEKLAEASEESQKIGEFLDWLLHGKDYEVCQFVESYLENDEEGLPREVELFTIREWYDDGHDETAEKGAYIRVGKRIEDYLAEYFKIDMKIVEEERRAMLNVIQAECSPK